MTRNVTEIFGKLAQRNKAVGESMITRSFRAGETVGTSDDISQHMYLVASGRVQLYRTTGDGRRFVIATLRPGSMFGEDSLLGGQGPNTVAVALESRGKSSVPPSMSRPAGTCRWPKW